MFRRLISPSSSHSYFLFGARGTGKSTYLNAHFAGKDTLWIDLLSAKEETVFRREPDRLSALLAAKPFKRVVIDEVQKIPKLLDVVQKNMLLHKKCQFILTGSSARKLKRGSGNLLAGRAFTYHIFPLTFMELEDQFDLESALNWGTLPGLVQEKSDGDRAEFLRSYVQTYLKEEILQEQLTRKSDPFREFLPIVAQHNGKILNFSSIASDLGVDDKTVLTFFQILEDTLLGFFLPPYHKSVRKRQRAAPKFYVFDLGIKRAMDESLSARIEKSSYGYGEAFEHLVLLELLRLREYLRREWKISYLRTKDDAEIDIVVDRPRKPTLLIEIKSTKRVGEKHTSTLKKFLASWPTKAEGQVWSLDPDEHVINDCKCIHWQRGLTELTKR